MNEISLIIPTLWRAAKLDPLVVNIINTTPAGQFSITFVVDTDDLESQSVIARIDWPLGMVIADRRGYVHATNLGVQATDEPLVAIFNDDIVAHSGWYEHALAHLTDEICVISPNDLSPQTENGGCTMPIVRRSYINQFGGNWNTPGLAYYEGYRHTHAETELWELACHRGVAMFVDSCVIEHRHPDWGLAPNDMTYELGAQSHWDEDAQLFQQRKQEWTTSLTQKEELKR